MRRIYALFAALLCFGFWSTASAQLNLSWDELGPNNMGNHVRAMVVDGNGTVWAGSVGGGLWSSTDGGLSWTMVSGLSDNLAVSSIAVNGSNIYVGTGELYYYQPSQDYIRSSANWKPDSATTWQNGFFQYSGMIGEGVFVSNDGGATWSHNNGTWGPSSSIYNNPFTSIQKIESQGNRTFIGTLHGLYYSDDANLANVTKVSGTVEFENDEILDIAFGANNVVYATTKDTLYRSTNNGMSFVGINDSIAPSSPLPGNQIGGFRLEVAVAPSNPNVVYCTGALGTNFSASGAFRSTDNGVNWTRIAPKESSTFQPFQNNGRYSMILEVSPSDENKILMGGEKLYKYTDANGWDDAASHTFIPGFSTRYSPTPILCLAFDPNDDSTFYVGTDAEIVSTTDFGDTYNFRTKGLNTSHIQGISAAPNWRLLASDSYRGLLYKVNANPDPLQQQWNDIYSTTRGGIGRFSMTNPSYIISQTTDGGLVRSLSNGATFESFYGFPIEPLNACLGDDSLIVDRPDTTVAGAGMYDSDAAPVNPWILDEYISASALMNDTNIQESPAYIYMCSGNFIWVCTNPFGTLDSLPFWNRITLDIANSGSFTVTEYFTAITVSGDADHVVYAGTNFGKIFRLNNANDPVNFDPCSDVVRVDTNTSGMPSGWISDLEFQHGDPENLIVTYAGNAMNSSRVWITNNAKSGNPPSFRDITGNLPANLPVYSAAVHPDASVKALVLGTSKGIWTSGDDYEGAGSITWTNESGPIGNGSVYDLVFRLYGISSFTSPDYFYGPDYTLFAGVQGRGVFRSRSLVAKDNPTLVGTGIGLDLAPNPMDQTGAVVIDLPEAAKVVINAYDITGTHVGVIVDRKLTVGHHEFGIDAQNLPSGVYILKAEFTNSKGTFVDNLKAVVTH